MSVEANGTAPFTYEWSKDFVVIPGATAAQYEIASADLLDAGVYSVRVINAYGEAESMPMYLDVGQPPTFITQPLSSTAETNSTVTFSVEVEGTAPLTYQWYRGETPIEGATQNSYVINNVTSVDNGAYWGCG